MNLIRRASNKGSQIGGNKHTVSASREQALDQVEQLLGCTDRIKTTVNRTNHKKSTTHTDTISIVVVHSHNDNGMMIMLMTIVVLRMALSNSSHNAGNHASSDNSNEQR